MPTRILGVIPARFASSRFPGKALAVIAGKTMLQHVFERASAARYLSQVIIATDDDPNRGRRPIVSGACKNDARRPRVRYGPCRRSGLGRLRPKLIVNIQGDEPLIDPAAIDAAC